MNAHPQIIELKEQLLTKINTMEKDELVNFLNKSEYLSTPDIDYESDLYSEEERGYLSKQRDKDEIVKKCDEITKKILDTDKEINKAKPMLFGKKKFEENKKNNIEVKKSLEVKIVETETVGKGIDDYLKNNLGLVYKINEKKENIENQKAIDRKSIEDVENVALDLVLGPNPLKDTDLTNDKIINIISSEFDNYSKNLRRLDSKFCFDYIHFLIAALVPLGEDKKYSETIKTIDSLVIDFF